MPVLLLKHLWLDVATTRLRKWLAKKPIFILQKGNYMANTDGAHDVSTERSILRKEMLLVC